MKFKLFNDGVRVVHGLAAAPFLISSPIASPHPTCFQVPEIALMEVHRQTHSFHKLVLNANDAQVWERVQEMQRSDGTSQISRNLCSCWGETLVSYKKGYGGT